MSDISVLSSQYEQLVATSDSINSSAIAIKKQSLLKDAGIKERHPKLSVSDDEVSNARSVLVSFFENVSKLLEEDYKESAFIPITVLDDYKQRLSGDPYLKEDLLKLVHHLKTNQPVSDNDVKVLDVILSILDSERSTIFRKLRTARG